MTTEAKAGLYEQFQAERQTGIGASDMLNLFSLPSPYSTIPSAGGCVRRLWYEKRGTEPDFPKQTKPAMERGIDCEEIVARKLAAVLGKKVTRVPMILRHPNLPYLIAHVDREVRSLQAAVECKTMNGNVARKVERVGLNDGYLLQMQAILLAGNGRYAQGYVACLNMDTWELLPVVSIYHDYEIQQKIRSMASWLWSLMLPDECGPPSLEQGDPRCFECQWRTKCQGLS